jgi:sensor histidine kinase YesM
MKNIYNKKQSWKLFLAGVAVLIVSFSLWYTNELAKKISSEERQKAKLWAEAIQKKANLVKYTNELFNKIKAEERKRIELWAGATKMLFTTENDVDRNFYLNVVTSNTSIPVILTDEKHQISSWVNIDSIAELGFDKLDAKEKIKLKEILIGMEKNQKPIEIPYYKDKKNYLYYADSKIFVDLKQVLDDLIKSFISEVVINSATVPVIYTDESKKNVIAFGNIDSNSIKESSYVNEMLNSMAAENTPIEVELGLGKKHYIFYKESSLLTQLKYFPYVLFGVISLFLFIAYLLFSTARNAEQNQVWVGLAKETAHQLGTPLSSLMAWVELLKLKGLANDTTQEIEKDIAQLEIITERFSKIGSQPDLKNENMVDVLEHVLDYLKARLSDKVIIELHPKKTSEIHAKVNIPLFNWVIENLCKNAIDAMHGKGKINIHIYDQQQYVFIDISDSGKGIQKSNYKTVFEPGFTTKKRGWGLGLSLAKRIIENYHKGKIFIKNSELDKGTTFRIVLHK